MGTVGDNGYRGTSLDGHCGGTGAADRHCWGRGAVGDWPGWMHQLG